MSRRYFSHPTESLWAGKEEDRLKGLSVCFFSPDFPSFQRSAWERAMDALRQLQEHDKRFHCSCAERWNDEVWRVEMRKLSNSRELHPMEVTRY